MQEAAEHGFFEQRDAEAGGHAHQENAREAGGAGNEVRRADPQMREQQEGGADAGGGHADRCE